jgi:hypothetical protein
MYFPMETILPLADPGAGIAADKGAVVEGKLGELSLGASDAIFAHDSEGNFLSSVQGTLAAETVYVQPRRCLFHCGCRLCRTLVVIVET